MMYSTSHALLSRNSFERITTQTGAQRAIARNLLLVIPQSSKLKSAAFMPSARSPSLPHTTHSPTRSASGNTTTPTSIRNTVSPAHSITARPCTVNESNSLSGVLASLRYTVLLEPLTVAGYDVTLLPTATSCPVFLSSAVSPHFTSCPVFLSSAVSLLFSGR